MTPNPKLHTLVVGTICAIIFMCGFMTAPSLSDPPIISDQAKVTTNVLDKTLLQPQAKVMTNVLDKTLLQPRRPTKKTRKVSKEQTFNPNPKQRNRTSKWLLNQAAWPRDGLPFPERPSWKNRPTCEKAEDLNELAAKRMSSGTFRGSWQWAVNDKRGA
jgi:hypothetical protein